MGWWCGSLVGGEEGVNRRGIGVMTNELVFLEPNKIDSEPFTTSDIVADSAGISYRSVQRMIEKHQGTIELYGKVRFEITPSGKTKQPKRVYQLNEQQATVLITLLGNTPVVVAFKVELVRQFFAMRKELSDRRFEKTDRKLIRRSLTDTIQALALGPWAFKQYTDLAYLAALGKTAKKIREEHGAPPKAVASDYMSAAEISSVKKAESQISVLLEITTDYQQIKSLMMNQPRRISA